MYCVNKSHSRWIIFLMLICAPALSEDESNNFINFPLWALCRLAGLGNYSRRPRSQVAQCFLIFVTKMFVSEISKDLTWATQGREEGRWVSVSNDCCCEDSAVGADYINDLITQPRSSMCDGLKRSEVKMVGGDYTMKWGGGEEGEPLSILLLQVCST